MELRDAHAKFREAGVALYAISYDDVGALAAFAKAYGIDYPLLSDVDSAVIRHAKNRDDALSQWINELTGRKHVNVVVVALANKTARVAWAIVSGDTNYDPMQVARRRAAPSGAA